MKKSILITALLTIVISCWAQMPMTNKSGIYGSISEAPNKVIKILVMDDGAKSTMMDLCIAMANYFDHHLGE